MCHISLKVWLSLCTFKKQTLEIFNNFKKIRYNVSLSIFKHIHFFFFDLAIHLPKQLLDSSKLISNWEISIAFLSHLSCKSFGKTNRSTLNYFCQTTNQVFLLRLFQSQKQFIPSLLVSCSVPLVECLPYSEDENALSKTAPVPTYLSAIDWKNGRGEFCIHLQTFGDEVDES